MTILMKNVKDTQTNQAAANVHIPLSEFRPEQREFSVRLRDAV
jgi:hypothetical protein